MAPHEEDMGSMKKLDKRQGCHEENG